jgi:transposase, IS5 family
LSGRCDSFVVETDVAFPTDIGLLFTALRKAIQLTQDICKKEGMNGWRQYQYNIRSIKRAWRKAQQSKLGGGKDKEQRIIEAHQEYIALGAVYLEKLRTTFKTISYHVMSVMVQPFLEDAGRQIDQIQRRIIYGEVIPCSEKVYSLFERCTEWVNKGKAGGKIELGLKVCVVEDQNQFILHHHVMEKEVDSDIAVKMAQQTKDRFREFNACSFDKGFASKANQAALEEILESVTMPQKGKLSQKRYEKEHDGEFIKSRHRHSAVESAINCLEHHGLDRCLDKGIEGFKRYVAIAIVGRSIQRIGYLLRAKELEKEQRLRRKLLKVA